MSKTAIYLSILLVIIVIWVIYYISVMKNSHSKEHFTDDGSDYDSRMTVMKIFDMVLSRKPSPEEIEKYASIKNEQDMLVQILQDYKGNDADVPQVVPGPLAPDAPAETNSQPVSNIKTPPVTVTTTSPSVNQTVVQKDPLVVPAIVGVDQDSMLHVKTVGQETELFDQQVPTAAMQLITVDKSRVQKLVEEIYERISELKSIIASKSV